MENTADHVKLRKPRTRSDAIVVEFEQAADSKKHITDKFLASFLRELTLMRSADGKRLTFSIRHEVDTAIRTKAVTQAKETILRRIDGKGVKEAAVSVRDEDIIVEIPGSKQREFQEIRDIISETARLEFKMLDDEANFFEKYAS